MLLNRDYLYLPIINSPKYVVFSDFDETYLAHQMDDMQRQNLQELEDFLLFESQKHQLIFGWVTGSSTDSIFSKIEKYKLKVLPHFLASSLGTDLRFFIDISQGYCDKDWDMLARRSGYSKQKVYSILFKLKQEEVVLVPQLGNQNACYKQSYYYYCQNEEQDKNNIQKIKKASEDYQVNVNISRCNPLSGDPDKCYDVDFIPKSCGKMQIVKYILDKLGLNKNNAFAFGDGENDIEMLQSTKYSYLVKNATNSARLHHQFIADYEYTKGILWALKRHIL